MTLHKLMIKRIAKYANTKVAKRARKLRHTCIRNIHFIFDRAVKKFKADVGLWLEWAAYAQSASSGNMLSKIYARALQIHPRNAFLWIRAAAWEFEEQRHVTAARTLLQRGLRLNPRSAHHPFSVSISSQPLIQRRRAPPPCPTCLTALSVRTS